MKKILQTLKAALQPYLQAIENDRYLWVTVITIFAGTILTWNGSLVLLAFVAFIQNMAFTASSRSRNSANPQYHFGIACVSNSIWFLTNYFLILDGVLNASIYVKLITGLVYTASTSYGSMLMMIIMLKKESGKNRVGATKE